jgi:transposase
MQNGQVTYTENGALLTLELYHQLLAQTREQEAEIMYLKQELAQLKRMIFGSKSERHIGNDPSQLSLGLNVEAITPPEKETEQITYTRNKSDNKKGSAVRLALPSHLHREEHIIEPEEDITGARKIGEVVTEILEYTPGGKRRYIDHLFAV